MDPEAAATSYSRALGALEPFCQAGFGYVWAAGWLWTTAQWMSVFLASYFVNQTTGSALLVQLAGAIYWLPLLIAGPLVGAVADRADPRVICRTALVFMVPIVLATGLLYPEWGIAKTLIYPLMFIVGIAGTVNNVVRKTLVYALVGPPRLTQSMALEAVSRAASSMLGPLLGGIAIQLYGIPGAFVVLAALWTGAWGLLRPCRVPRQPPRTITSGEQFVSQLRAGLGLARRNVELASLLGITVLANLFYFPVTPLVPVLAHHLGAGPWLSGLMAGAAGLGMLIGSLALTLRLPARRGRTYVLSPILAVAFLIALALAPSYWIASAALFLAGVSLSGFSTMQTTLTLVSVSDEMRGRAMGLLAMAIGGQPIGIIVIGGIASATSPGQAVLLTGVVGLTLLVAWSVRRGAIYRVN